MAEPLTPQGAIPTMDDAVRLLRQAPLGTWVCHWTGSAPFALLAMWFWNDLTNPRTLDSTGVIESLALTILLVWMNCWRSVFAGRLRRQLGGTATDAPWTARRIWRLVAVQSFFGATRLVVMPLAWVSVFPLASAVAFYRNLAVLADRDDLEPGQLMTKARKLAGIHTRENWALLSPLALLYLVLAVNLGIVLGLLPQLVRMLTGYESAFSRSGSYFALNPLFFLFVFAVSWIAFDPFVQAVYCVRCFRGESLETGEDLRAGLRRMGARGSVAAAALLLAALAAHASAAVPPGELEKSVHQTMQSHEYDWRLPPAPGAAAKSSWLVRMVDHIVAGMKSVAKIVGDALEKIARWILGDRQSMRQSGAAPGTGLHWSIYLATGVVALIALTVLWRQRRVRAKRPVGGPELSSVIHLDAEDLSPDRLPEERWMELAAECLRDENFRLALRALYLANLAWLGRLEFLTIDAGKTNREYELELRRRARSFAEARTLFAGNIAAFERAWYGLHDVGRQDIDQFRGRLSEMKAILPEPRGERRMKPARIVLVLLLAGFAAGAMYLFGVQFAAGDVYPEYSSLRTDPMGTKLLFDSLSTLPGITVARNYLPLEVLSENGAVLLVGLNPGQFGEDEVAIERVERLARSGRRVVVAMGPPTEYQELMALALGRAWEVKLGADSDHKHVHRLYITEAKDWTVLDRVGPKLLAIERDFGKGSVALFAESEDFTNQATVAGDRLEMISMAIGPSTHVIFDEQHLGIAETGSFVGLARRFRLTGLALGLGLCAALFLWRSASGFPPPAPVRDISLSGRTSQAGLINLLRRHIPQEELAATCWQEWLSANRRKVSAERIQEAAAVVRSDPGRPLEVAQRVGSIVQSYGAHT